MISFSFIYSLVERSKSPEPTEEAVRAHEEPTEGDISLRSSSASLHEDERDVRTCIIVLIECRDIIRRRKRSTRKRKEESTKNITRRRKIRVIQVGCYGDV